MSLDFAIQIDTEQDSSAIVSIKGELDLFTAPEFKARVAEAVGMARENLIIDFSRAKFIDSSSLGVLIGAHRRQTRRGGRLVVVCDREPILKVLRITGLDGVFPIVGSFEDVFALDTA